MGADVDLRDLLVVSSIKEFEDTAVRIASVARHSLLQLQEQTTASLIAAAETGTAAAAAAAAAAVATAQPPPRSVLTALRREIRQLVVKAAGLFNMTANVHRFAHGMAAIAEQRHLFSRVDIRQSSNWTNDKIISKMYHSVVLA